ncbi:hypothetical protein RI054_21g93620 [Pseudoscourfieldia marina]
MASSAPSSSSPLLHRPSSDVHPTWRAHFSSVTAACPVPPTSSPHASTSTSSRELRRLRSRRAASKLVLALPPRCVAFILGMPPSSLLTSSHAHQLALLLRAADALSSFSHGTIDEARRAWSRLRGYMESHSISPLWDDIPAYVIGDFLLSARESAAARPPRARAAGALQSLVLVSDATPGHSVVTGLTSSLRFLATHTGLRVSLDAPAASVPSANYAHPVRADPPALSLRAVFALEACATDPSASVFVRHAAAALYLMCLSSLRFEQLQDCEIAPDVSSTLGMIGGVTRPKRTDGSGLHEEHFWFYSLGVTDSPSWRDALLAGLADIPPTARFQMRAWDGLDVYSATSWRNGPASSSQALRALRSILDHRLGPGSGAGVDLRSPRHFLPEVAAHRGESSDRAVEIGRWSASSARSAVASTPSTSATSDRVGRFPRLYGATGTALRVCQIIRSQVDAVCAIRSQITSALSDAAAWALLSSSPAS